jgi:hypothetical protein
MWMKMSMETWWNNTDKGKPKYLEEKCPSAILSTINLTWPGMRSRPGLRGEKPATNRLRLGTVRIEAPICVTNI